MHVFIVGRVSDGGRQVSPGLLLRLTMTFRLVTDQGGRKTGDVENVTGAV